MLTCINAPMFTGIDVRMPIYSYMLVCPYACMLKYPRPHAFMIICFNVYMLKCPLALMIICLHIYLFWLSHSSTLASSYAWLLTCLNLFTRMILCSYMPTCSHVHILTCSLVHILWWSHAHMLWWLFAPMLASSLALTIKCSHVHKPKWWYVYLLRGLSDYAVGILYAHMHWRLCLNVKVIVW